MASETNRTQVTRDNYIDAAAGLYWYAADYHGGQWSELYSIGSTLGYAPGMGECSPGQPDTEAPTFYAELEAGTWDASELRDAVNAAMDACPYGRKPEHCSPTARCSACTDS